MKRYSHSSRPSHHDGRNQVARVTQVKTRSWSLDLVGSSTTRTLNDTHAPVSAGTAGYTYDARGNMTSKPGYTFVWDLDDHLVQSVKSAQSVDYKYDAFGNRIQKGDTRYVLKGNQVLAEYINGNRDYRVCCGRS